MQARTVTPQQLAEMLGVCKKTAARMMRRHPRCFSIGAGTKEYLRLPIEDAKAMVAGECPIFHTKPQTQKKEPPIARRRKTPGRMDTATPYVKYR